MLSQLFRLPLIVLATGAALLQAAVARADNAASCAQAADIVAVADDLLVEPAPSPEPDRRRIATEAAFLKIRYGALSYAGGRQLIDRIRQWQVPPDGIDALHLTFARPADRATLLRGAHPLDVAAPTSLSVLRAVVLDDNGRWLFREMKRRAVQSGNRREARDAQRYVANALLDLSDSKKTEIAGAAEAEALWDLAEYLLASKTTADDWLALVRRAPGAPANQQALTERFRAIWTGSYPFHFDHPRRTIWRDLPPALRVAADAIDDSAPGSREGTRLLDLSRRVPLTLPFLFGLTHHATDRRVFDFADPIIAELDARQWDMVNDHDAILILVFRSLDRVVDRANALPILAGMPSTLTADLQPPRPGGERMLDVLESAIARRALIPYLRGNDDIPPTRPDLLTQEFDWVGWVAVAEIVRAGESAPQPGQRAEVELLDALGRYRDALRSLRQMPSAEYRRDRAYRMLASLDGRCAGLLSRQLGQQPLYRFEPR